MVRKKFEITEDEYKEFTNKMMIKTKVRIVLLTGIIVFVGAILFTLNKGVMEAITTGLMLFVAYIAIVFIGLFIFAPFFTRKAYKKNNVNMIKFDYEILETGIKQNKNMFLYESVKKVVEEKYSLFLYLVDKQVILLPKRIFDENELNDFKKLLQQKIKNVKLKNTNKL